MENQNHATPPFFKKSTRWRWALAWWRLWNFIGRHTKFHSFLHPNEHTKRIFWYQVKRFDWRPLKIGIFGLSKSIFNVKTQKNLSNEVGARSYKNTGRSNAAWVRVKKRFTGIRPVEGYWRFHRPPGWQESSIPFHSRTKACEPFHYANPGCVGSPGVFITPGTYFIVVITSDCHTEGPWFDPGWPLIFLLQPCLAAKKVQNSPFSWG